MALFKCDLISDSTKRLDRNALSEIASVFKNGLKLNSATLFSEQLASLITKEDIEILRFSRDFGLGIFNGIEIACLPHGEFMREDLIERSITFELFIAVSLCLAPSIDERVDQLIIWIDCAYYLFEKLKNFYAFNYVMSALNHPEV